MFREHPNFTAQPALALDEQSQGRAKFERLKR